MKKIAALVALVLVAACGGAQMANANDTETPINWDRGHIEMVLDDPGQSVVYFVMHGHECIVVGDSGGDGDSGSNTLALSCNWSPK